MDDEILEVDNVSERYAVPPRTIPRGFTSRPPIKPKLASPRAQTSMPLLKEWQRQAVMQRAYELKQEKRDAIEWVHGWCVETVVRSTGC